MNNCAKLIRGIITSITAGAEKILRFTATGRAGETIENRELFQQYGFQSAPPAGAEAVLLRQGNNIYIVATDDRRYRIALQDGEVAIADSSGNKVHLQAGGKIAIVASASVTIDAAAVELGGDSALKKLIHEDIITALSAHVHTGVTTGPGVSGTVSPGTFTTALHATSRTQGK